jgi:hypothetical protein
VSPAKVASVKYKDHGPGRLWQKVRPPSPKLTRAKRAGGEVQAVEFLPCKHNALSSNLSGLKKFFLERRKGEK